MKTTAAELDVLLAASTLPETSPAPIPNAFQLPSLHSSIPTTALVQRFENDDAQFAKNLLAAKVIKARDIPPTATSVQDVIKHGLKARFQRQTSRLRNVQFSMGVRDAQSYSDFLESGQDNERNVTSAPALFIEGPSEYTIYTMKTSATWLERNCPGLFRAAFQEVEKASYKTVEICGPNRVYDTACHTYWWVDWSEADDLSDKDARETLIERFGDEAVVDEYLPSVIKPLFGGKLTLDGSYRKRKSFGDRRLKMLAKTSDKPKVRKVASQVLALRRALNEAHKLEADLPDLCGTYLTNVSPACILVYQMDDRVTQVIDDIFNDAWNAGEGTETLGAAQFPETVEGLALYFKKLDAAFNVLLHMDKLISLISKPLGNLHET